MKTILIPKYQNPSGPLTENDFSQRIEDIKHPNGHYLNETVVTPDRNYTGTLPQEAMWEQFRESQRNAQRKNAQDNYTIQHNMSQTGADIAKGVFEAASIPASFNPVVGGAIGAVYGATAAKDIKDNGLNWSNGLQLGLSALPLGRAGYKGFRYAWDALPNPEWYRNALLDVTTRPLGTYRAIKNGQYIHDFSSLMRNARSAKKALQEGMNSTTNEYQKLTGFDFYDPELRLVSWKKAPTGGLYSPSEVRIKATITKDPMSNIRMSDNTLKFIGGHEQTHYLSDALTSNFNTPKLGVYSTKTDYFVPNLQHPIAAKYEKQFMDKNLLQKLLFDEYGLNHGRFPEETWANYMGSRAIGQSDKAFRRYNFNFEGMSPPKGFISDYKQYLTDTYSKFSDL